MIMRLEISTKITTNTKSCGELAAAIIIDENDEQPIFSWMHTEIPITVTTTKNNQNRER